MQTVSQEERSFTVDTDSQRWIGQLWMLLFFFPFVFLYRESELSEFWKTLRALFHNIFYFQKRSSSLRFPFRYSFLSVKSFEKGLYLWLGVRPWMVGPSFHLPKKEIGSISLELQREPSIRQESGLLGLEPLSLHFRFRSWYFKVMTNYLFDSFFSWSFFLLYIFLYISAKS